MTSLSAASRAALEDLTTVTALSEITPQRFQAWRNAAAEVLQTGQADARVPAGKTTRGGGGSSDA